MRTLHRFLPFLHDWTWVSFIGDFWKLEKCVGCGDQRVKEAA